MINLKQLIKINSININLYGILFVIGSIFIFFTIKEFLKSKNKNPQLAYSAMIYLLLGTLVCARLFYAFYYFPSYFINKPIAVFYLWNGGLSFHGGLLGSIIMGFFFCKKNKINYLEFGDMLAIPLALFLSFGRLVNFLNNELIGKITSINWCGNSQNKISCRHPIQIYSSIKNFIIFLLLIQLKKRTLKKGVIFITFVFLYSFLRFFIDFFREYNTNYFGLGAGQFLNIITALISLYFLYKFLQKSI